MFKSSIFLIIIRHACRLLALLSLTLLSGCSTIQIIYNQADEVLYWWLDGYVDLTDKQKPLAKEMLRNLHQWHRQTQLPEYVLLLQKIRTQISKDIQPEQACSVIAEVQESLIAVLQHIEPEAGQFITQLKPEQLQNIRKKQEKLNKEWREDYLDVGDEKRLRQRTKQSLSRLEDFYGKLDAPQREVLKQWLSKSSFVPATSYEERLRRQNDAVQTFSRISQGNLSSVAAQTQLRAWVERSFFPPDEAFQKYSQALKQENCEGFAKLHNSTTRAQRERLAENLRNYENIFQNLVLKK
jgi:hypothetical protein